MSGQKDTGSLLLFICGEHFNFLFGISHCLCKIVTMFSKIQGCAESPVSVFVSVFVFDKSGKRLKNPAFVFITLLILEN